MSRLVQLCAIVCGFLAALSCVRAQTDPQDRMVHVAISQFAENNPNEAVLEPTVEAIRNALGGDNVVVHRLPLDRLQFELRQKNLDFVLSSAGNYRRFLIEGFGLRDLATLASKEAPDPNRAEGSVFVVSSARPELRHIENLRGKIVAANYPTAFTGWQVALGELHARGIDPDDFFRESKFLGHGALPVLEAVRRGEADVGIVRTCVLERSGLLESGDFRVLDPKPVQAGLRCLRSTDLYPNWTFAATPRATPEMSRKVLAEIFSMAPVAENLHWSVATDFIKVDALFRDLKVGPFAYLRQFSLKRFLFEYWPFIMLVAFFIAGLIAHGIRTEFLVHQRTAELTHSMQREQRLRRIADAVKERIRKIEKVGLIGQMCSMIAHDLKQPLGSLSAYCFTLRRRLENGECDQELLASTLEKMDRQIRKASDVVDQVRGYSKGERQRSVQNLSAVTARAVRDLKASLRGVQLLWENRAGDVWVEVNRLEIEIILINLVNNAVQALEGTKNPMIRITLEAIGREVELTVMDNGPKIDDDRWQAIARAAAQTTRRDGLGFGLSIVTSLTEDLGGRVHFARPDAGGLSVSVRLPIAEKTKTPS